MHRVIFHLDMDAFYASVEQRDNPALRGKPVIVGAPPTQRGVVCAASYEARKFGVRSAIPSATAGRLCPKGIFVRPRMDRYREESQQIMQIMAGTGAIVEQMSIDEAYLDLSAVCQAEDADASLLKSLPLARELKQRIKDERHLTATIGIAANKLLAKIASDHQKPDGLTLISEKEKVQFLRPLPVRALYGVGKVTEQVLHNAGVRTIGDLQGYPGDLRALVGSFAGQLKSFAVGEDDRPLELGDEIKSISGEETFLKDTDDRKVLRACLKEQANDISTRLKHGRLGAHTVQVKVRYGDFLRERQARYLVGTPKSQLKKFQTQLAGTTKIGREVQAGVEVKLAGPSRRRQGKEQYILCRSSARRQKEAAMIELARQRLRAQLDKTHARLQRRPAKDAGKVERRIGRWLGRFPAAERLMEVTVERNGQATRLRTENQSSAPSAPSGPPTLTAPISCAPTAWKKTRPTLALVYAVDPGRRRLPHQQKRFDICARSFTRKPSGWKRTSWFAS